MPSHLETYLSLVALNRVGATLGDPRPAFVVGGDRAGVRFLNAAAARLAGLAHAREIFDRPLPLDAAILRHVARFARAAAPGRQSVEMVRFFDGMKPVMHQCVLIHLGSHPAPGGDGKEPRVLVIIANPPRLIGATDFAASLDLIADPARLLAAFDAEGEVLTASGDYALLDGAQEEIEAFVIAAADEATARADFGAGNRAVEATVVRVGGETGLRILTIARREAEAEATGPEPHETDGPAKEDAADAAALATVPGTVGDRSGDKADVEAGAQEAEGSAGAEPEETGADPREAADVAAAPAADDAEAARAEPEVAGEFAPAPVATDTEDQAFEEPAPPDAVEPPPKAAVAAGPLLDDVFSGLAPLTVGDRRPTEETTAEPAPTKSARTSEPPFAAEPTDLPPAPPYPGAGAEDLARALALVTTPAAAATGEAAAAEDDAASEDATGAVADGDAPATDGGAPVPAAAGPGYEAPLLGAADGAQAAATEDAAREETVEPVPATGDAEGEPVPALADDTTDEPASVEDGAAPEPMAPAIADGEAAARARAEEAPLRVEAPAREGIPGEAPEQAATGGDGAENELEDDAEAAFAAEPGTEPAVPAAAGTAVDAAPAEETATPGDGTEVESPGEPARSGFVFSGEPRARRFVWQMDGAETFTFVSGELAAAVGPRAADVVGRRWAEVAEALGLDAQGRVAAALARRDTWSGLTVLWPVEGEALRVPVDLAALPAFGRRRDFEGYRGFGVCRVGEGLPDPSGTGMRLARPAYDGAAAPEAEDRSSDAIADQTAEAADAAAAPEGSDLARIADEAASDAEAPQAGPDATVPEAGEATSAVADPTVEASEPTRAVDTSPDASADGAVQTIPEIVGVTDPSRQGASADAASDGSDGEEGAGPEAEAEVAPLPSDAEVAALPSDAGVAALPSDAGFDGPAAEAAPADASGTGEPARAETDGSEAETREPVAVIADGVDAPADEAPALRASGMDDEATAEADSGEAEAAFAGEVDGRGSADDRAAPEIVVTPSAPHGSAEVEQLDAVVAVGDDAPAGDSAASGATAAARPDDAAPAPAAPVPVVPASTPAGRVVPVPTNRNSRIVTLPSAARAGDAGRLTAPERIAFRQIAAALGARIEGEERPEERKGPGDDGSSDPGVGHPVQAEAEAPGPAPGQSADGGLRSDVAGVDERNWPAPDEAGRSAEAVDEAAEDAPAPIAMAVSAVGPAVSSADAMDLGELDRDAAGESPAALVGAAAAIEGAAGGRRAGDAPAPLAEPGPFARPDADDVAEWADEASAPQAQPAVGPVQGLGASGDALAASTPAGVAEIVAATRLLDRLPIGAAVLKDDGIAHVNVAFLDLLGFDTAEDLEAAGGIDAIFAGEHVARRFDDGAGNRPQAAIARDGEVFPVNTRLVSIPWGLGSALLMTIERRMRQPEPVETSSGRAALDALGEARERASELEAIVDTATDGVLMLDADGRVVSANRAAEALFGLERADMVNRPLVDLLAPESRRSAQDYLDGLARNGVASVLNDGREIIGRVSPEGLIPLFMTIGRISSGPQSKFCAVLRDITQWKKSEEELTAARRKAEEASVHKSEFLAKISHEIRTPLNAIIGFSEVILDERFGQIGNDRYKDYLKDIHTSGTHIMSLINDLLDLSKVEAGKMELKFEAVSLADILGECVALMQPQANRERIIIRTSLPSSVPPVVADPRSVRQIVLNLLSNAVKFTPAGGQVIVSTAFEDTGEVVVRVRDTGLGMTDKEIQTALEPFRQLHTTRVRGGGTGLGLPLTKALVEANRASFRIDSAVNQGTLVSITFPVTRVLAG